MTRRAEVELHNCIGKYAIEHGYSLVQTLDVLQGGMRKYYQNLVNPPVELSLEMEDADNLTENANNDWR